MELIPNLWQAHNVSETKQYLTPRYDSAAPRWGDKMRTLGYYDSYLGFLSAQQRLSPHQNLVVDVGSGTCTFAEAWVAIHGSPKKLTLIESSAAMLRRGMDALRARGVDATGVQAPFGDVALEEADAVLAAHVIEHFPNPLKALQQMYDLLRPGGKLHLASAHP
ncbi:MAG: ubiquinone/menaquinone biosynthesis C-methylase UbiE [Parasphingorhabdus sp.]|jgi:ubiquinone/menaquinone biosynthesis C-methylase UbiE